jgi:hypothetical protein
MPDEPATPAPEEAIDAAIDAFFEHVARNLQAPDFHNFLFGATQELKAKVKAIL